MAEKILVVDDDLDSLKLIGLMLQRNGYEVIAANSGKQAIAKAADEHPSLVILDVMMPDMNGYEVCKLLREDAETKAIPIIMFTAKTMIDDKVAGFEAGADDYLTKPTHPAELASRVRSIIARSRPQRPASAPRGATIGVLGAKGGVGTTTIALNLAAARVLAGENAIVTDFRLGAGSLGLALGFDRPNGLANVLRKPLEQIRPKTIEGELLSHSSGIRALLSSPLVQEARLMPTGESAVTVVRALRSLGRPAVFDLGSGLSPLISALQREMDQLVLVIDPTTIAISMARELLQELEANQPEQSRIHLVVVNRAASGGARPAWHQVEQLLNREVRANMSLASELIAQAQEAHVPIVMYQPAAVISTQIIKLADDISARVQTLTSGEVLT
ncbi:MAG: response regulator [Chloroflexi bacterium]|nr:response regulator [Chloroflexota bacterium]